MAHAPAYGRQCYGDTAISGSATAVLGNHYGDSFQIVLVNNTNASLFSTLAYERSPNALSWRNKLPKLGLHENECDRNRKITEDCDAPPSGQSHVSSRQDMLATLLGAETGAFSRKDHIAKKRARHHLLDMVQRNSSLSSAIRDIRAANERLLLVPTDKYDRHFPPQPLEIQRTDDPSLARMSMKREHSEALAFATLIIAILAYRNLSFETLSRAVNHMKNDPLFPYISILVACWATNFMTRMGLKQTPSESLGNSIMFEDAYQQRSLTSVEILASEDIFQAFLRTRFRDSSAKRLVEHGNYNLMIGGRFGRVIDVAELCSKSIEPGSVLVMSLRYNASSASCLECTNKLRLETKFGWSCSYCRRSYGVPLVLSRFFDRSNTALYVLPPWEVEKSMVWNRSLGGLKHVDLEIPVRVHPLRSLVRSHSPVRSPQPRTSPRFQVPEPVTKKPFQTRTDGISKPPGHPKAIPYYPDNRVVQSVPPAAFSSLPKSPNALCNLLGSQSAAMGAAGPGIGNRSPATVDLKSKTPAAWTSREALEDTVGRAEMMHFKGYNSSNVRYEALQMIEEISRSEVIILAAQRAWLKKKAQESWASGCYDTSGVEAQFEALFQKSQKEAGENQKAVLAICDLEEPSNDIQSSHKQGWTVLSRILVNPAALQQCKEEFKEKGHRIIVSRELGREEIVKYADLTKRIRESKERKRKNLMMRKYGTGNMTS